MKWSCTVFVLLCACRMGGTGGSALALVEPEVDGGMEAGMEAGSTSRPSASEDGDPTPTSTDAGSDTEDDSGSTSPEAGVATDGGDSAPVNTCNPTFTDCDPVQNTNCPPLTQCMVDPSSDGTTGSCGFSNLQVDAGVACEQNPFGTSCPPKHGCIQNQCLRYCVCDSDCNLGSTCSVEIVTSGTGVVKACSP